MNIPQRIFTEGIFFNQARQGAPAHILGSLSISKDRFQDWLFNQETDEKGYVKLDVKLSKEGKPYLEKNTWTPTKPRPAQSGEPKVLGEDGSELPF